MAAPMRSSSQEGGHRARVADSRSNTAKPDTNQASNFEYDDNEWDIGIGDLIIDLDADIEKTKEGAAAVMATNATAAGSGKTAAKMAIEHSATVDKGLKMKIKRTKPGTKTSEAKHEIVKSNEQQNGTADGPTDQLKGPAKHPTAATAAPGTPAVTPNTKRGSSGHRREKAREKHPPGDAKIPAKVTGPQPPPVTVAEVNGIVRVSASQPGPQRPVFPASTGPGPPPAAAPGAPTGPTPATANASVQGTGVKQEQGKGSATVQPTTTVAVTQGDDRSNSPPVAKKFKMEPKEVTDVCVGTSVGTITEPDCLGPCEPGTSVTLEGIVWHETEGGVLVVNVTWRGKTYVGTLLDCTRHDWAPPRFCDSPTSDLDTRTPKGRETRSSVHSKLRNGGGVKGRRGAAANGSGPSTAPSSPTPFVPPRPEPSNKRKTRVGDEEASPGAPGKKTKVAAATTTGSGSPPPSPVMLECPEPNCCKKYKNVSGLKYHQSRVHGSVAEDEDTKDVTSMSENDESNIEAPSPATPVKSPDKSQDSPLPKKDGEIPLILRGSGLLEVPSQPVTPRSTPPSPATPQSLQDLGASAGSPSVPLVETKNVVKPGILRYGGTEEFAVGAFSGNNAQVTGVSQQPSSNEIPAVRSVSVSLSLEPTVPQPTEAVVQPQSFANQLQAQVNMPSQQFSQPPSLLIPAPQAPQIPSQMSPHAPQSPTQLNKVTQFKVKSTAALMPDEKKDRNKLPNYKKKPRKSPAGSPDPSQTNEAPIFGLEQSGREEVQSPAYSDISDDGAPVLDQEIGDKSKTSDKKTEMGQPLPHMPQYGMYPFYGQPPYLVPTQENKGKEPEKLTDKPLEKDVKKEGADYQQKVLQQHYYPYGYVPGYTYNMDPTFGSSVPIVPEEKIKEERIKENPSPSEHVVKPAAPIPNPIQVPTPGKVKTEISMKEKHQNENHQILKESIEMKNQMNSYMYSRQQQQPMNQREEDGRRFYVYPDQRRKEQVVNAEHKSGTPNKAPPPQSPNLKHKDKPEEKKEKDIKQEGVKPTMETQGPPPPPTSQYAYIHPSYMQSPHYGALAFDPNHPMYRSIMVPGPYSGNPYLHHQLPRYHAPEDLSRAPPPTKALDMLQHHAQYYSSHKIHELQERALKSPTPKTTSASASPSANAGNGPQQAAQVTGPPTTQAGGGSAPVGGKQTPGENKESRSPPPQRHVHTHHHTHVGLGYPMYAPAPYGAAVLASQQAAAVTVINPYPPNELPLCVVVTKCIP